MKKFLIFTLLVPIFASAHGGVNDEELIIRMTGNGFEPKELTVVEGDEVLFINNDDADRWPASNFHPTHTIYPEFDPMKGIPPGESWKHTFDKAGTWRMHDHLIPHFTGTIVVLEDTTKESATTSEKTVESPKTSGFWAKIKAFFAKLFKTPNKTDKSSLNEFKSLTEKEKYAWLEDISSRESPEAAWKYVVETYNTPEGVVGNPHDMAHLVGQLIYKKYGFEGLSICEPLFAFGCYHGLMEVAFDKDKPEEYNEKLLEAKSGCDVLQTTSPTSYWSCIHGIGHGIATFREHEINLSLKDCSTLPDSLETYCQDGVFMEFSISAPENFYTKNNPMYPCDIVAENAQIACARSQVQVMRLRFGLDTAKMAGLCTDTGKPNIIYHCIDALGYFIGQNSSGNPSKIVSDCKEIRDDKSSAQCMAAAAGELVFQNSAGWQSAVQKICLGAPQAYQAACKDRIAQVKDSYER